MSISSAQVLRVGAEIALNSVSGKALTVVSGSAPGSWTPGVNWVDTGSSNAIKTYNGSAWVVDTGARYLALVTADPSGAVASGDLTEVVTAGYARISCPWSVGTVAYPSVQNNTGTLTWGPMTADMLLAATHVVEVTTASGALGWALYAWKLNPPEEVATSQSIQIATSQLTRSQA